jgi:hypothetical protein
MEINVIDVAILNRNLGQVCDQLVAKLLTLGVDQENIVVVDCSTNMTLASTYSSIQVATEEVLQHGLRFNRGMNIAIDLLDSRSKTNDWILFLPVDTEINDWNMSQLLTSASQVPDLVAIKPLDPKSAYLPLLEGRQVVLGWNFEEGPWLVRRDFVTLQRSISPSGTFFDDKNFRGYLTSLELGFRAYSNDFCVGATSLVTLSENELYLIERNELMQTETKEENWQLMLVEGERWLSAKYGFLDPWTLAWVTRLMFEQYVSTHPESRHLGV